jgi:seryl-tRNA synthetase
MQKDVENTKEEYHALKSDIRLIKKEVGDMQKDLTVVKKDLTDVMVSIEDCYEHEQKPHERHPDHQESYGHDGGGTRRCDFLNTFATR